MALTIFDHDGWTVNSFQNGAAYSVTGPEGGEYFVQYGDAASQFRANFDELDELSPGAVIQHLLAEYMPVIIEKETTPC